MSTATPENNHAIPMTGSDNPSLNSVLSDDEGQLIVETPALDERHQVLFVFNTLSIVVSGIFTVLLLLRVVRAASDGLLDYVHWTNYAGIATGVFTTGYCLAYFYFHRKRKQKVERLFAEVVLPAYTDMTGKRYDGHMYTITEPRQTHGFVWTVATRDRDGNREMHYFTI